MVHSGSFTTMAQLLPGVTVTSVWVLALLLITAVLQHSERTLSLGLGLAMEEFSHCSPDLGRGSLDYP